MWWWCGCRKILEDDNLDEETKAAQKEEMERRKRLQEIQEKLRQQAAELRAQREKEMLDTLEQLQHSALKSLLDGVFVCLLSAISVMKCGNDVRQLNICFFFVQNEQQNVSITNNNNNNNNNNNRICIAQVCRMTSEALDFDHLMSLLT